MSEYESDPSVPFESKRVPFERTVILKFDRFSGFIKDYSANISMGGMFIKTNQTHEPGSVFEFVFKLADDYNLIQGLGEVVWVNEEEQTEADGERSVGMGIRFLELDWESRKLIFRLVDQYIQDGGVPFDVELGPNAPQVARATEEKELIAALGMDDGSEIDQEVEDVISAAPWPDDPGATSGFKADAESEAAAGESTTAAGEAEPFELETLSDIAQAVEDETFDDEPDDTTELSVAESTDDAAELLSGADETLHVPEEDLTAAEPVESAAPELVEDSKPADEPEPAEDLDSVTPEPAPDRTVETPLEALPEEVEEPELQLPDVEMPEEDGYSTFEPYGSGMAAENQSSKRRSGVLLLLPLLLLAAAGVLWMMRGGESGSETPYTVADSGDVGGAAVETVGDAAADTGGAGGSTVGGSTVDGAPVDAGADGAGTAAADPEPVALTEAEMAAKVGADAERLNQEQMKEGKKQARTTVQSWAAAWSNQDSEGYLSFYSKEFVPSDGSARADWAAQRRQRLAAPSYISVELSALEVKLGRPGFALATFEQSYESNTYKDKVKKRIRLKWENGQWKIFEEASG